MKLIHASNIISMSLQLTAIGGSMAHGSPLGNVVNQRRRKLGKKFKKNFDAD